MYLVKSPWWLKKIYTDLTWKIATDANEIFLTFDDGPHPTITPFVLDALKAANAHATFFCIGKNVRDYPNIYYRILEEGHKVGNHTDTHVNGWKASDEAYLNSVIAAKKEIDSKLFRPPYGRITKFQIQQLAPIFNIIMWDVLSGDFDINLTPQQCLRNVVTNSKPGSIVVFHDSEKAYPRLKEALPAALKFFTEKEFAFKVIPGF